MLRQNLNHFPIEEILLVRFHVFKRKTICMTRGVGREGAGGAAAPPDFGGSEGAAGQRRCAALLPAPPDF